MPPGSDPGVVRIRPASFIDELVALTLKGARTRTSLMKEFYHPPRTGALEREELQVLERALSKLAPADPVDRGR